MNKTITNLLSASLMGALIAIAAPSASAQDGSARLIPRGHNSIQNYRMHRQQHPHGGIVEVKNSRHGIYRNPDRKRHHRHICSPSVAVQKAMRFGVRHAEIKRINKNLVVVSGRKRGHKLVIGMERRSRHCSIAFVRHQPRHGYSRGHRYGYRF